MGWISVRPLQYGNVIRFFENWKEQSHERTAALFRVAVPGLEEFQAEDVGEMLPSLSRVIEHAICRASGLVDAPEEDDDDLDEEETPEDAGMFSPPEEALESATEYRECDTIDTLHELGYTIEDVYALLLPEIDLILEGAGRREQRKESSDSSSSTGAPAQGNRGGSHASELW